MEYILTDKTHELLNVENVLLSKATLDDLESIIDLYKDRINWFKENKIDQWTHFLDYTPRCAFETAIKNEDYFILIKNRKIVAGFEVSTTNKYFEDDINDAYYLYKLVTKPSYKKLGKIIFDIAKDMAIQNNKRYLRLDCLTRNRKLNDIYNNYGFILVKETSIGNYNCSLRELKIF